MRTGAIAAVVMVGTVVLGACGSDDATTNSDTEITGPTGTTGDSGPEFVTVPSLKRLAVPEQVDARLSQSELVATYVPNVPVGARGCVAIGQEPFIGARVTANSEIRVTFRCKVPNVIGLDGLTATRRLRRAGFGWKVDACGSDRAACTVLDQTPFSMTRPGERVLLHMDVPYSPPAAPSGEPPDGEECEPSYPDACLDPNAYDYDCLGGPGNGPEYIAGPLTVLPPDPFGLDHNHNGLGCED